MNGSNSRKVRQFWNGPGFYAVMLLLVTAIAVAGYWTIFPSRMANTDPVPDSKPDTALTTPQTPTVKPTAGKPQQAQTPSAKVAPVETDEPEVADLPSQSAASVQSTVELTVPDQPVVTPAAPRLIVSPLEGETVAAFSVDALQYSQTLDDWRTHNGVDIAAEVGTPVLAACSGTVQHVWQDDLLGCAVLLDHGDGYETLYANLDADPTVSTGEYVSAGQALGTVGTTALSETALPAHLHFAVTCNGKSIDPEEFLNN